MERTNFWSGFIAGAVTGVVAAAAGVLVVKRLSGIAPETVLRLEKSVNVGRPVETVFNTWSNFERLPQFISFVKKVERAGNITRWTVEIDGREIRWDAEIAQIFPYQSIGWKSLSGPKHTGRITFAPLGNQTVVHVVMNYAPRMGKIVAALPLEVHLAERIERGLREFKLGLEQEPSRKTGTSNKSATQLKREKTRR